MGIGDLEINGSQLRRCGIPSEALGGEDGLLRALVCAVENGECQNNFDSLRLYALEWAYNEGWDIDESWYGDPQTKIGQDNYYLNTYAVFTSCDVPDWEPDTEHESVKSLSRYWIVPEGVYRYANHWGRFIRDCDWFLDVDDGSTCFQDMSDYRCGFCRWEDFEYANRSQRWDDIDTMML